MLITLVIKTITLIVDNRLSETKLIKRFLIVDDHHFAVSCTDEKIILIKIVSFNMQGMMFLQSALD